MDILMTFAFLRKWLTCGLLILTFLQVVATNVTEQRDDIYRMGNSTNSSTSESYDDTSTSFPILEPRISTEDSNALFSTENVATLETLEFNTNSTELLDTTVTTLKITENQTSIPNTEQLTDGPTLRTNLLENATWSINSSTSIGSTESFVETGTTVLALTTVTEFPSSASTQGSIPTKSSLTTASTITTLLPMSDFSPEKIEMQLAQTEYQLNVITGVYLGVAFILVAIVICNCIAIRSIKRSLSENLSNVAKSKKRPREYTNSDLDRTSPILPRSNYTDGGTDDYLRFPYLGRQNPATGRSIYNNFPVPQNRFNYLNPNNQDSSCAPPNTAHPTAKRGREFYDAYHHEWNSPAK